MEQPVPPQPPVTPKPNNDALPIVLIVVGALEAVVPCILLFVTVPQFLVLSREHHFIFNPITTFGPLLCMLAVILSQVVFGVKLRKKQKLMKELNDRDNMNAVLLLAIGGLIFFFGLGISLFFIITPIYDLLSTIK